MVATFVHGGLLSGIVGGCVWFPAYVFGLYPLLLEAEFHESGLTGADLGSFGWGDVQGSLGSLRVMSGFAGYVIAGVGQALLLTAMMLMVGRPLSPAKGVLWGLGAFLCLSLVPLMILGPQLPGIPAVSELSERQMVWCGAVAAAAAGLLIAGAGRGRLFVAGGVALMAFPHVVALFLGDHGYGIMIWGHFADPGLMVRFAVISLAASAVSWVCMGGCLGRFLRHVPMRALPGS